MISERLIPLSNARVNFATGPVNGPPLLMLHGVTRRWQSFLPMWAALETRCQLISLDYRGHGLSDRSERPFHVVDYLEDLLELVDRYLPVGLRIYGHSMGAMLAAAIASRRPDKVHAVILEDPPQQTMGPQIGQTPLLSMFQGMARSAGSTASLSQIAAQFGDVIVTDPQTSKSTRLGDVRDPLSLRFTAWCLSQLQPEVLQPIIAGTWLDGYDIPLTYSRIQCPVLLLQADLAAGGMLTDDDASSIETWCPEVVRLKFPGVGHLIHWLRTPDVINHTLAFLETARGR